MTIILIIAQAAQEAFFDIMSLTIEEAIIKMDLENFMDLENLKASIGV